MSGSNFSHLHQLQRGLSEIASIIINITISANLRPRENVIYQIYLDSMPQLDEMSVEVKIKESLVITNMTVSQANNTNGTRDIQFGCEGGTEAGGKFLVFVLDVSGSKKGGRIDQLKSAMDQFLTKMMSTKDFFSLVTYSSTVKTWRETYDVRCRGKRKHRENARSYVNELQPGALTNRPTLSNVQFEYIGKVKEDRLQRGKGSC